MLCELRFPEPGPGGNQRRKRCVVCVAVPAPVRNLFLCRYLPPPLLATLGVSKNKSSIYNGTLRMAQEARPSIQDSSSPPGAMGHRTADPLPAKSISVPPPGIYRPIRGPFISLPRAFAAITIHNTGFDKCFACVVAITQNVIICRVRHWRNVVFNPTPSMVVGWGLFLDLINMEDKTVVD